MKKFSLMIITLTLSATAAFSQTFNNAGDYMTAIANAHTEMDKSYMAYMSAAAHSGSARKIEKMRQQTLESIINCKSKIIDLPYYKGDNSLRKSSMTYVDLCYKVFNEDYTHIVNMEEIAEQSFDEMEAYLLLEEKTNEKIQAANDSVNNAEKSFAAKYNVQIVETKSELGQKLEMASQLNHYHNQVYLIFFKCNWEHGQLVDALNKKNLTNIEQARNALIGYADEGLAALDSLQEFNGDRALAGACRQALKIYKSIAQDDIPKMTDMLLKQENFDKMKTSFDAKGKKTKEDVDTYNKAVNELNAAVKVYNVSNEKSNNSSTQAAQMWNDTEKSFLDAHMPYYE